MMKVDSVNEVEGGGGGGGGIRVEEVGVQVKQTLLMEGKVEGRDGTAKGGGGKWMPVVQWGNWMECVKWRVGEGGERVPVVVEVVYMDRVIAQSILSLSLHSDPCHSALPLSYF